MARYSAAHYFLEGLVDLGVEYIVASRRTEDGQSGHLNRLQVAAKYSF